MANDRYEAWRITYQSSEQAARAAFAEMQRLREDAERLDALEALVMECSERALLLHHGWHKPREPSFCGLGLSNTGRSLRQAIDQVRGKEDGNG